MNYRPAKWYPEIVTLTADQLKDEGNRHLRAGRYQEALAAYDAALARDPHHPGSLYNRALVLLFLKRPAESAAAFEQAAHAWPDDPVLLANWGAAAYQAGDPAACDRLSRQALRLDPDVAEAHANLGTLAGDVGAALRAADHFQKALALQPDLHAARINLSHALRLSGQPAAAADAAQQVQTEQPAFPGATLALAQAINDLGHRAEALVLLEGAEDEDAAILRGNILKSLGRYSDAIATLDAAWTKTPSHVPLGNAFAIALLESGEGAAALGLYDQLDPDPAKNRSPASNALAAPLYVLDGPRPADLARRKRFDAALTDQRYGKNRPRRFLGPGDPLRVALISADLHTHSVSWFLKSWLGAARDAGLEITLVAARSSADAMTEQLRALVPGFIRIAGLSADEAAEKLGGAGFDVIVELGGHTDGNRLDVMALRPAGVQASWLGYPDVTGLSAINGRIVDALTDPPEMGGGTGPERLIRMEAPFLCYGPPLDAPEPRPRDPDAPLTFASFNNPAKLTPGILALWAGLLTRVPGSRLLLKGRAFADPAIAGALRDRFVARGIERQRILCEGWAGSTADHLARYHGADIALDTFPYNGTTTTCEALWMGVPVISRAGRSHAARVGLSLLTAVGLSDLVATSDEAYLDLAAALAGDPARLADLRLSLRDRMRASPLCDGPRFAGAFAEALRRLYHSTPA